MTLKLFDLSGKTALVTGAGQGLGLVLARGLGQAGAAIVLNDRNEKRLEDAVHKLHKQKITAYGTLFDIRFEKEVEKQIQKIENNVAPIDILVNNAGVQIRGPLEDFPTKKWQQILDTNLTGMFFTTRAIVKGMINRRNGKIINICSIQSELARPTIAPYTASKGGVKMLTKAMATDWAKYGIQVNGIAPGYFKTKLTRKLYENPEFDSWLCARTPANRWGEPEELIGAAVFLASGASDYVNGHILVVDGGMLACV